MMAAEESATSQGRGTPRYIETRGGTYVRGDVNTGGGDFVGRDTIGAETSNPFIQSNDSGQIHGTDGIQGAAIIRFSPGADPQAVEEATTQVLAQVSDGVSGQQDAHKLVYDLLTELARGVDADDFHIAELLERSLATVPALATPLSQIFANRAVAKNVGPATRYVLDKYSVPFLGNASA